MCAMFIITVKLELVWIIYRTYWVADILSGCGDNGEHQEEGCGGRVMQPEDAGVDGDTVGLDQALEAPEDVKHRDPASHS